jgi:hemoglobin-like flavoprotein
MCHARAERMLGRGRVRFERARALSARCCIVTPEQKVLVQESFGLVVPIADTAAELFYARLFELDPSLRRLFPGDMREQAQKLMQMLTVLVRGLHRLDMMVVAVQACGRRHAAYGVSDAHFETVGTALLWTLEQGLGSAFTPEVAEAWSSLYAVLSSTMKDAMADVSLPLAA